jgi:hypothetical protein
MMVVETDNTTRTIRTNDDTRFYIDRSDAHLTNSVGDFEDCTIGRRVEVKLGDDGKAEWVKIDAS